MRGRKPKPTAQKVLEGNPGKRPLNTKEPVLPDPSDTFDAPPPELLEDVVAGAEWTRLTPMLRKARTITEADRGSLVALCQQWSRYLEANRNVSTAGMVIKSPSGYPMPNPYIGIANKALGHCLRLWAELGITPSSRSRVTTAGASDIPDPFDEFDNYARVVQSH